MTTMAPFVVFIFSSALVQTDGGYGTLVQTYARYVALHAAAYTTAETTAARVPYFFRREKNCNNNCRSQSAADVGRIIYGLPVVIRRTFARLAVF